MKGWYIVTNMLDRKYKRPKPCKALYQAFNDSVLTTSKDRQGVKVLDSLVCEKAQAGQQVMDYLKQLLLGIPETQLRYYRAEGLFVEGYLHDLCCTPVIDVDKEINRINLLIAKQPYPKVVYWRSQLDWVEEAAINKITWSVNVVMNSRDVYTYFNYH